MTAVFFAEAMSHTPFDEKKRAATLSSVRIAEAPSANRADVIIARRLSALLPFFDLKRRYYIWTHEPFWAPIAEQYIHDEASGTRVAVSSAFNGDVYQSPLYYFPFDDVLKLDQVIAKARQKSEFCAFLATYRADATRYVKGANLDLSYFRQSLAVFLQRAGLCKIYGRSWPEGIQTEGESRGAGWHKSKLDIIDAYTYNIGIENTVIYNYVTEKLWDPIRAGCVQVYFGAGSGVEQVMPAHAFIDGSGGVTFEEIAQRFRTLSQGDREEMLAASVGAYNAIREGSSKEVVMQPVRKRFAERIGELVESGQSGLAGRIRSVVSRLGSSPT